MDPTLGARQARRRRLLVAGAALAVVIAALVATWPIVLRHVVLARLHAVAHRPVSIESVEVNPFSGRIAVRSLRVLEPDGSAPFAGVERFDARVKPLSLLRGHVWLTDVSIAGLDVKLIRRAGDFNVSDLLEHDAPSGRAVDLTVDRLAVTGGQVVLEDRALPEPRTWTSEQIEIAARDLSTVKGGGTATARSVTAGAPVSLEMRDVRLAPIHLEAVVTTTGLDVGLARLYMPPGAPVVVERGRASSRLAVVLDAVDGVRADATGEMTDVTLVRPGEREPAAIVPIVRLRMTGLAYGNDALAIDALELAGSASVRDPSGAGGARYEATSLRASIGDVTWPVVRPGTLDVESSVPGGGIVRVTGQLRPPPAASQLRLRASGVDLAPWAELVPLEGRLTGIAEADLQVDEPLAPGVPHRVRGSVAVSRAGVGDGAREVAGADRIEASSFEVQWPARVTVGRLAVTRPRAIVERTASGALPLRALLAPGAAAPDGSATTVPAASPNAPARAASAASALPASSGAAPTPSASASSARARIAVDVGEVVVDGGRIAWRDDAVTPRAALDMAAIDARVKGAAWPPRGALDVAVSAQPPGGGRVAVRGKVGVEPLSADVRVTTQDVELAPYRSYVPVRARIDGRADLDVTVVTSSPGDGHVAVKGRAALVGLDVRDDQRSVLRADRAAASGIDVEWPRRARVAELTLRQPWVLVERGRDGITPMTVLAPATGGERAAAKSADRAAVPGGTAAAARLVATVDRIAIEEGGARVVDQQVTPPFAIDLQGVTARVDGLSTDPRARPATLDVRGRVGGTSILTLAGTVGSFGGPLRAEVNGDLRGFAVPRTNPYLLQHVAWAARDGWLTTTIRARIDDGALDARSEVRISRLQVARAGGDGDEAKARIGLPLGLLVALMKDSHGDIAVALPVSGKLNDPKFDFSEAIWSAIRNVAVKAVMAPISWIGRVQLSPDSRIQRIEVDPIPFAPGAVTLSPEAREQASRVAAFLEQSKEVRMALAPVVTARDRAAIRQAALDVALARLVRDERLTPDAAAERLFRERFPQRPVPSTPAAVRAALAESDRSPGPDLAEIGAKRLEVVRAAIRRGGVDGDRLVSVAASTDAADGDGRVALELVAPEDPGPAARPSLLERVLGAAPPGSARP